MFKKTIRLAPAIPDWTKLKRFSAKEKEEAPVPGTFEKVSAAAIDQGLLIQQEFAEDFCKNMSEQLSLNIVLYKLQAEKMSYTDFISQFSREFLVQVTQEYPEAGSVFGFWGYSLAQALINRLTGGEGAAKIENEEFTAIERSIFESVLQAAGQSLAKAWKNILPESPQKYAIYTPRLKSSDEFLEKEEVLLFSAEVGLEKQEPQQIRWLYSVENYNKLFAEWSEVPKAPKRQIQLAPNSVSLVDVPVAAYLGKAIVSMADLLMLQRGDVLVLDKKITDPSSVNVGVDSMFSAQPGSYNEHLAVQLLASEVKLEKEEPRPAAKAMVEEPPVLEEEQAQKKPQEEEEEKADKAEEEKDDILDNIEDFNEEDDEDFVWDEEDIGDEDF